MPDKKKKSALGRLADYITDKVGDGAEYASGKVSGMAMRDQAKGKKNSRTFREVLGGKKRIDLSR